MLYSLTSEVYLEDEVLQLIKKRDFDQKFLYMGEGADNFYNASVGFEESKSMTKDTNSLKPLYFEFLDTHVFKKSKGKGVIISLGCGSGFQEKPMLEEIVKKGYDIDYMGNDCSRKMLHLAQENLDSIRMKKSYIFGDFLSPQFVRELKELTAKYDYKVFSFMGCTFGNPNQTSITDSLYNMLGTEDYLLFDVASRNANDANAKIRLFERYTDFLDSEYKKKFWFTPLQKMGIPKENGKMILRTGNEDSVGSFLFKFIFQFTHKTVIELQNERIHFLPGEEVKLIAIRNYDPKVLQSFFEGHEFELIDSETSEFSGGLSETQFLFKKK